MEKKLKCYLCKENCQNLGKHELEVCYHAVACWKTSILNKDGTKDFERGCSLIDYSNMHQPSLSNYSFLDNGSSAYDRAVVEYCLEDYCNDGPFPDFTGGFKSSQSSLRTMAIVVPMVIISTMLLIAIVIILCMASELKSKSRVQPTVRYTRPRTGENSEGSVAIHAHRVGITGLGGRGRSGAAV